MKRLAIEVEDHPLEYGKFEGIIPAKQYGAGVVMLWDKGEYEMDKPPMEAYQKGNLTFLLKGQKLKGKWTLVQIKNQPKQWLLIKAKDIYAQPVKKLDITETETKSALTHRTMEEIGANSPSYSNDSASKKNLKKAKKSHMLTVVHPQLATLADKAPAGDKWLHEIKLDGYRIICFIKKGIIKLMTRNQNDWTEKFPFLVKEIKALSIDEAVLDGEVVAYNEKTSNFQLLQNLLHLKETSRLIYHVFDILYDSQRGDITQLPLIKRKEILHRLIPSRKKDRTVQFSDYIIGNGEVVYRKACQFHFEGIISKRLQSSYVQKRTTDWLKIKCVKRQEFVVAGFTTPQGKRKYFGSLLLGVYAADKKLHYCGHVGTGFTEESLEIMWKLLKKYRTTLRPFIDIPRTIRNVFWVKPRIVVEIEFLEWTEEGVLRHPSFKGIRNDKPPKDIIRETV